MVATTQHCSRAMTANGGRWPKSTFRLNRSQTKGFLEENDKEARETRLKELEFAATDENAKRDYLMRASLVQMVEEANAII